MGVIDRASIGTVRLPRPPGVTLNVSYNCEWNCEYQQLMLGGGGGGV